MNSLRTALCPRTRNPWGSDLQTWPARLLELHAAREILAEVFDITSAEVEEMIRLRLAVET